MTCSRSTGADHCPLSSYDDRYPNPPGLWGMTGDEPPFTPTDDGLRIRKGSEMPLAPRPLPPTNGQPTATRRPRLDVSGRGQRDWGFEPATPEHHHRRRVTGWHAHSQPITGSIPGSGCGPVRVRRRAPRERVFSPGRMTGIQGPLGRPGTGSCDWSEDRRPPLSGRCYALFRNDQIAESACSARELRPSFGASATRR